MFESFSLIINKTSVTAVHFLYVSHEGRDFEKNTMGRKIDGKTKNYSRIF